MNKEDRYRMARARGKKITKYVATGLAAVIFLVCLTGCGGKDSADTKSSSGRKRAGTVDVERITFKASKYSYKEYAAEFPKGSDYAFLTDDSTIMGRRDTGIMVGYIESVSYGGGDYEDYCNMTDEEIISGRNPRTVNAEVRRGDSWVCFITKDEGENSTTNWEVEYYAPKGSCQFELSWHAISSDDHYYSDEFIPVSPVSEDEFVKEFKCAINDVAVYMNDELIKPSGLDIF